MSFKETDFTGLIGYLKGLLASQKDPMLFREMVAKLVEFYDELPVYPGIVNMCLGQAQKTVEPKELKKGQRVFLTTAKGCVSGILAKKSDDKVALKEATSFCEAKTTEVELKDISKAVVINEDIVKELWPSLVFDKEQK